MWRTPCRLEVKPSFHVDDDTVATHLYRIAREAVINANKHAQARQIVVKLERSGQRQMVLSVTDDGVGVQKARNGAPGLGFHIMNHRAGLIGGRLKSRISGKRWHPCGLLFGPQHTPIRQERMPGQRNSLRKSQKHQRPEGNRSFYRLASPTP